MHEATVRRGQVGGFSLSLGLVFTSGVWTFSDVDPARLLQESSTKYAFAVELCDETGLGPSLLSHVRADVSRIYSRASIAILWLDCGQDAYPLTDQSFGARVYVRDHLPRSYENDARHMGCVFTDWDQRPGPIIYVAREEIERFISRRQLPFPPRLVRAIGRVIAHELSHRFLQSPRHTKQGILKETFSRRELTQMVAKSLYFTRDQVRFLHSNAPTLGTLLSEFRTSTGTTSSQVGASSNPPKENKNQ